MDTVSRDGTISLSIQESNTGSDIQGKDELLVSKTLPQIQSQTLSSKQSPSQDSDIWHSESEANWTMVENPFKDLTQSQVLSEDEPKQFEGDSLHTSYATPVSQCAKKDAMKKECYTDHDYVAYGFEPPRSTEVFGDCSWNSLCLAVSSKDFQEREGTCTTYLCVYVHVHNALLLGKIYHQVLKHTSLQLPRYIVTVNMHV